MKQENEVRPMGQVIKTDEGRIRDHLGEMVRGAVEETLNAMLDGEADELCGAGRYRSSAELVDTRAGSYDRTLHTSAGEVKLKVPKLRQHVFETAIIERSRFAASAAYTSSFRRSYGREFQAKFHWHSAFSYVLCRPRSCRSMRHP